MVKTKLDKKPLLEQDLDAVLVGVFQDVDLNKQPAAKRTDSALDGALRAELDLKTFRGRFKETRVLATRGAVVAPRLALLGYGKRNELDLDRVRELAGRAATLARELRVERVGMELPPLAGAKAQDVATACAEGVHLALFDYREFKSAPTDDDDEGSHEVKQVVFVETRQARHNAIRLGLHEGEILASATNLTRTLIVRPSVAKAPADMVTEAKNAVKGTGVSVRVLTPPEMKKLGMGAILGVGQGSQRPPRMVILDYKPAGAKKTVLLCGKGIVFDSGGINIKPSQGLEMMKYDMAGSATVLGAIQAAARLKVKTRIVAIMALAENMPSGSAQRPGDVVRAYNKTTIEIGNTDAEGRLVLADALSYGVEKFKPDYVVDVATLTGAAKIALGNITTAVMGNNDAFVRRLIEEGKKTGDDLWQLPLHAGYHKQIKSDVADVRNMGTGTAGTITAAAFLEKFVDKRTWAHFDIAGTSWTDRGPGDLQKSYLPKGPTGIGVRLLTQWMRKP